MRLSRLIFAFIILLTFASAPAADVESASKSRKWHNLIHYRSTVLLSHRSEIDPSEFFLSPEGHKSPLAELQATVAGFQKDPKLACRFPARLRFLIEEMGFKFQPIKCEQYENWRKIFNPQSMSLVFASAFFGNAASAFGHTFLRIDGTLTTPNGPSNALLDYGLNFSAQVPSTDGGLTFAFKGLTGGYRGVFSTLQYIKKLQEYRDREERDLWEYHLNLNSDQISRLLEHLWELESSKIPYYFLNKNCSYNLLALLEVANSDWKLTDSFTYWAIPSDTIRVVVQIPNAVKSVSYRPSLHRQLVSRMKAMTSAEEKEFLKLRENSSRAVNSKSALVLDSLLDEQKFRYGLDSSRYPEAEKLRLKSILQARAQASGATHKVEPKDVEQLRVDQASGSRKISLAGGQTAGRNVREIEFRAAYHDALDANQGGLGFSEISVFQLRFRQISDENKDIHLDKFNLIKIVSLSPMDALQKRLSWTLSAGITTAADEMASQAKLGKTRYLQAGAGVSTYLMREKENLMLYSFLKLNAEHSDNRIGADNEKFRYGPSVQAGLWFRFGEKLKAGASTEYFSYSRFDHAEDLVHFHVTDLQLSWLFHRDWNARAEHRWFNDTSVTEHRIALSRYF